MPSTGSMKALGVLDLEHDQRDWNEEFPVETESEATLPADPLRRKSETLFTVVRYGRPMPITLPEPSATTELRPSSRRHHRSVMGRVKRAISPALTALFVAYIAIVLMTAWIGVRNGDANKADSAPQVSAPASDPFGPANRP